MNGKDVLQEFCDPKDWQQLAQVAAIVVVYHVVFLFIYTFSVPFSQNLPATDRFKAFDVRLLHEKKANHRAGAVPRLRQRSTCFAANQGAILKHTH